MLNSHKAKFFSVKMQIRVIHDEFNIKNIAFNFLWRLSLAVRHVVL